MSMARARLYNCCEGRLIVSTSVRSLFRFGFESTKIHMIIFKYKETCVYKTEIAVSGSACPCPQFSLFLDLFIRPVDTAGRHLCLTR